MRLHKNRNQNQSQKAVRNNPLFAKEVLLWFIFALHTVQAASVLQPEFSKFTWFFWDLTNVFTFLVLSWLLFNCTDYRRPTLKLASFVLLVASIWSFLSFFVLSLITENYHAAWFLFFPALAWGMGHFLLAEIKHKLKSVKYNEKDSFLVYKQPKGLQGLIAVCLGFKGGGCDLVIRGRDFGFERGLFLEKPHTYKPENIYERVGPTDIEYARKFLGKKWKIYRHCFSVSRKIVEGGSRRSTQDIQGRTNKISDNRVHGSHDKQSIENICNKTGGKQ